MTLSTRLAASSVLCGVLLFATFLPGATPVKKTPKTDDGKIAVEKVLFLEAAGPVDRRAELSAELELKPDSNLLRWQSGYVRDGISWQPYESFQYTAANADQLAQYRERRKNAPQTAAGQLQLANWCKQTGLLDQERAHLFTTTTMVPQQERPALLFRLGYRPFGNQWVTREQLSAWSEWNRRTLAAVKLWGPKLGKIAEQLHGSARQRDAANAKLKELTDPAVIPAMEYLLCGRDEATASQAIAAFGRMPEYEATLALAKQAVFSTSPVIRRLATTALKSRPFEEFVPDLISLMATPAKSVGLGGMLRFHRGQFILQYSYVVARETEDQFQVAALHTTDYRLNEQLGSIFFFNGGDPAQNSRAHASEINYLVERSKNDAARQIAAETHQKESQTEAVNERTEALNQRIINVLAAVSERESSPDPHNWWQWWTDYTEVEKVGEKNVVRVDENDVEGDPSLRFGHLTSCFAAGTPVWTERGTMPIEQIKIGDRVLSKNVETGELAYKPVLHASVGKPKPLVSLKFADETITATGGHRFWTSGKGWGKARDLDPETRLHTATANLPVASVEAGPIEATYNLVVADFHTYFVGQGAFMVQDLPMPQSTNSVVPGMTRRQLATGNSP